MHSNSSSAAALPILPGAWLGLLGGGQLGRMFCMAAQSLGYKVQVLDPDPDSPAAAVADAHLCADFDDLAVLDQLAERCAAITTEFENIPAAALQHLAQRRVVRPGAAAVAVAQDRITEKNTLAQLGIAVAPYVALGALPTPTDLSSVSSQLFPGILKAARLGYDGKGQQAVATPTDLFTAFEALGAVPCVLEKRLPLAFELSVVLARSADGQIAFFPIAENHHRNGILMASRVPAPHATAQHCQQAQAWAQAVAESLGYVGVLCMEFFVLQDGQLRVNEIAPRPHNSGHYTLDACVTSQFEQQVRALTRLPLGSTRLREPALMLNLLGDIWWQDTVYREPDWLQVLSLDGVKLHLYGKHDPRPGRKMGHITCVAPTPEAVLDLANAVVQRLQLAPLVFPDSTPTP